MVNERFEDFCKLPPEKRDAYPTVDANLYKELQLQYQRFMEMASAATDVSVRLSDTMKEALLKETDDAGDTWLDRIEKWCNTCQMRTYLCKNLALSYYAELEMVPEACIHVVVKGLPPHGSTPYACAYTYSLSALQMQYAAESVVKAQLNNMFEKVVEQCEKEEQRRKEAQSDPGSTVVRFPGKNMDR